LKHSGFSGCGFALGLIPPSTRQKNWAGQSTCFFRQPGHLPGRPGAFLSRIERGPALLKHHSQLKIISERNACQGYFTGVYWSFIDKDLFSDIIIKGEKRPCPFLDLFLFVMYN
jgi:hypothetical protein